MFVLVLMARPAEAFFVPPDECAASQNLRLVCEWNGWEVASAEDVAVREYLEIMHFLRSHQVWRWESTGLVRCESGGNWHINTGNGYSGGLQFHRQTWLANGGGEYARFAYMAEPWQQAEIADRLVARSGGYGPWPSCARRLRLPT